MAWNPSPEVALARDLATKLEADQVMIVYIKHSTEQLGLITYGKTRALCADAKELGTAAYEAVRDAFSEEMIP